ncbi:MULTISPECIES: MATE family efflux transporter [Exiguobacterium]|uniref:MATE family efflux transporter n=1 Tax=Exiguobacterium TaxID=33986 RepID=UPI001AE98482|nr:MULTISPECIES: MATE family efflux transporter [Exiguobacterium]MCT4780865.1 MATE family efflux transporter [Exiguobacterium soli]
MVTVPVTARQYGLLAYPLILSGILTPLLGVTDTIAIGQTGEAVAIGAVFFNTIYWLFGFLKVSTTGFSAQASVHHDETALHFALYRPVLIGFLTGLVLMLCRVPLTTGGLYLLAAPETLLPDVRTYIDYRMYGAPFVLIGQGQVKRALLIQVCSNVINIILDVVFVLGLGYGVAGVAFATLVAEISIVAFGFLFIFRQLVWKPSYRSLLFHVQAYRQFFTVNADLFIRTIFLLLVTGWFTRTGAAFGPDVLAANAILLQIQYLIAYWFGGLGSASTILVGRARGRYDEAGYRKSVRLTRQFGLASILFIMTLLIIFQRPLLQLFSTDPVLLDISSLYYGWILIFPLTGGFAMLYEGIFSGLARAKPVRNSMIQAFLIFALLLLSINWIGNHGVWLAFIGFGLMRSGSLHLAERRLHKQHPVHS